MSNHFEKTLVLIKPDAVYRRLVGNILTHYENNRLTIENLKWLLPNETLLSEHYKEHIDKPFYPKLIQFMQSGPMIAVLISGVDAVERVRKINGATYYLNAECGSIRGKYASDRTQNLVHGSDSIESAIREINLWFPDHLAVD